MAKHRKKPKPAKGRPYFWDPKPIGLNADIQRHRDKARDLDERIEAAERQRRGEDPRMSESIVRTYRHSRYLLDVSLANVVDKLGRKRR